MSNLNPNERWVSNRLTTAVCALGAGIALALSPLASASENTQDNTSSTNVSEAAFTLGESAANTTPSTFESYTR